MHPSIDMAWFWSEADMPVTLTVVCNSPSGTYDFSAPFLPSGGSWDWLHTHNDLSGDWVWGSYFVACDRFDVDFGLDQQSTDYDMTLTYNWGLGVANESLSMDMVKALYR